MNLCSFCSNHLEIHRHHIIPASILGVKTFENNSNLIPVCSECNNFLSNLNFQSVEEMCGFLVKSYKAKYRKILKMPDWSEEDFEELSTNLELSVKAGMALKRATEARIASIQQFGVRTP